MSASCKLWTWGALRFEPDQIQEVYYDLASPTTAMRSEQAPRGGYVIAKQLVLLYFAGS